MSPFDRWWGSVYADKPKQINRHCYEEGYAQGYAEASDATSLTRYILLTVCCVSLAFCVAVLF